MSRPAPLRRFLHASALYPVSLCYLTAVLALVLTVSGALTLPMAVVGLALTAVLIVLIAMRREMSTVHRLVNSQHDQLVARIDQLVAALIAAGVAIPAEAEHPRSRAATERTT